MCVSLCVSVSDVRLSMVSDNASQRRMYTDNVCVSVCVCLCVTVSDVLVSMMLENARKCQSQMYVQLTLCVCLSVTCWCGCWVVWVSVSDVLVR